MSKTMPEYYEIRGWDPNTGKPTREHMETTGVSDLVRAFGTRWVEFSVTTQFAENGKK